MDNKQNNQNNQQKKDNKQNNQNNNQQTTGTQDKVNGTLDKNKSGTGSTDNKANLSSNALRSQDAKGESTQKAQTTGNNGMTEANNNSPNNTNLQQGSATQSQNFQVAAAVGLNITKHKANTNGKLLTRKSLG